MKCINCGATIEGTISGTLSKCDYCGTTNAFVIRTLFDETGSTQDEITANQKNELIDENELNTMLSMTRICK
jgi:hypothetical protein